MFKFNLVLVSRVNNDRVKSDLARLRYSLKVNSAHSIPAQIRLVLFLNLKTKSVDPLFGVFVFLGLLRGELQVVFAEANNRGGFEHVFSQETRLKYFYFLDSLLVGQPVLCAVGIKSSFAMHFKPTFEKRLEVLDNQGLHFQKLGRSQATVNTRFQTGLQKDVLESLGRKLALDPSINQS